MAFLQRDAPGEVRAVLRTRPWLRGVRVTNRTSATADDIHNGPYVSVVGDGTPTAGRATATENVRINVFSKWEPEDRDLAARIDAYLLDPSTPLGFVVRPGAQLLVIPDEQTKGYVAAVTVRAAGTKNGVNL